MIEENSTFCDRTNNRMSEQRTQKSTISLAVEYTVHTFAMKNKLKFIVITNTDAMEKELLREGKK